MRRSNQARARDTRTPTFEPGEFERLALAEGVKPDQIRRILGQDFVTFGEHLKAIERSCREGRNDLDTRLIRTPAGEGDPSSGGFLVGTQWARELVGFAYEEAVLAPLTDRRPTPPPLADIKIPAIDETSRADGSRWGGALAYWLGEAATIPATKPRFRNLAITPNKLVIVIFVSNELAADVPMLEAHIRRVFAAELGFKLDLAVLSGTGAGVPQGILNSSSLITVPADTGQAPGTISASNVRNMWLRLPAPSRRRAFWLVNEDADGQLDSMASTVGTGGVVPPSAAALYMPAGAGGNEYPLLKGRPVLTMEQCPTLGNVGDIVLADPQHYILVDGGVTPMLSVDVAFLTDESVWRFVLRIDGQSAFASPITPYNGSSNTRSPFVALAAR